MNSVVELVFFQFLNSGKCKSRGECVEFQCFRHRGCSQVFLLLLLFPPFVQWCYTPSKKFTCFVGVCTAATKENFFQTLLLSQVAVNSLPSLAVIMNKMDGCFWARQNAIDVPLFRHSFRPIPNAFLTSTALQQLKRHWSLNNKQTRVLSRQQRKTNTGGSKPAVRTVPPKWRNHQPWQQGFSTTLVATQWCEPFTPHSYISQNERCWLLTRYPDCPKDQTSKHYLHFKDKYCQYRAPSK